MTVNFAARKCSISDIITLIFYPENLFAREKPERLKQVMEKNAALHLEYGLDNGAMVAWNYRGWLIEGIPDQILEDRVIEGKVVRRASNVGKLKATAWLQGGFYALALGKPKFQIILFKAGNLEEYFSREFDAEAEEPRIKALLDYAIDILDSIRTLSRVGDRYVKGAWRDESLG